MPGGMGSADGLRPVPRQAQPRVPEDERPGFFETIGLGASVQVEDNPGAYQTDRYNAYGDVAQALAEAKGVPLDHYSAVPRGFGQDRTGVAQLNEARIWAELNDYRQRNPGSFADLPTTQAEYDKRWEGQRNSEIRADEQRAAQGNGVARFIGGMAGGFADPINLATLPLGGGAKTVFGAILREGLTNAAIEAVEQPLVAQERRSRGSELTIEEATVNVLGGFVIGGAIGGAGKYVGDNWDAIKAAPRAVQEKAWAAILDRSPGLRDKVGGAIDWDALDDHLPELAEGLIGTDRMTADERGAVAVLRGEQALADASPFVQDAAGREATQAAVWDSWRTAIDEATPSAPRGAPGASTTRSQLATSTSISSGVAGGDARTVFKQRVRRAESSGDDAARNPKSTATGRYQFIESTWLHLYKNRYGTGGLSDRQILAKRSNGQLQEVLMDDLTDGNERALRANGIAITPGNLYLAHFAGSDGARKLHANPDAAVEAVLGRDAVNANGFLRGMRGRDVIAWADRKMGGAASPVGGGPSTVRDGSDTADLLRDDIDRLGAEREALERDMAALAGGGRPIDELLDEDAVPLPESTLDIPTVKPGVVSAREEALGPEIMLALPDVRRVVAEPGRSLNRTAELASEMGMDETQLRGALDHLVALGSLRQTAKGQYVRAPREGPEDVLKFIARRGGLRDDEGHALGLKGLSGSQRREMTGAAIKNTLADRKARGSRDWQRFVPGAGPLLRGEGRSLDAMGEMLHEAGYFGPPSVTARPTTNDVMEMIERAVQGERVMPNGVDAPAARADPFEGFQSGEHYAHVRRQWDDAAERLFGRALDDGEFMRALDLQENEVIPVGAVDDIFGEIDPEDALAPYLVEMVNRELDEARFDAFVEVEDEIYAAVEDQLRRNIEGEDSRVGQGGGGQSADARDAGAQPGGGATGSRDAGEAELASGPIEPDRYSAYDDPTGVGAKAQADSLIHDIENAPDMFGGPTRVEKREALERQGDAPLRAEGAQRAAGSDGGLFDNLGEVEFRFDEDGPGMSAADLIADIREDEAMLKTIRDCL